MSEATAGLTRDEDAKLEELQAKKAASDAKAAKAAAEKKAKERAEAEEKVKNRPLNFVMVQHMGYAPETKLHRAVRPGGRKQRFMLDNGRRIRGKGERYTEVSLLDLLKNLNTFLGGIKNGTVQVCRPDNLQPISAEQLADLGERLAEDYKHDLKVDETLLEPLFSDRTDKKVWVKKGRDVGPSELVEPPKDPDITNPDLGQSELMAKVDQHEAEAKGEANPPPDTGLLDDQGQPAADEGGAEGDTQLDAGPEGGPEDEAGVEEGAYEEEVLTEAQMMEMTVKDLQKLAKEYKVKKPEKLHTKKELVDAIVEAASKEKS